LGGTLNEVRPEKGRGVERKEVASGRGWRGRLEGKRGEEGGWGRKGTKCKRLISTTKMGERRERVKPEEKEGDKGHVGGGTSLKNRWSPGD